MSTPTFGASLHLRQGGKGTCAKGESKNLRAGCPRSRFWDLGKHEPHR